MNTYLTRVVIRMTIGFNIFFNLNFNLFLLVIFFITKLRFSRVINVIWEHSQWRENNILKKEKVMSDFVEYQNQDYVNNRHCNKMWRVYSRNLNFFGMLLLFLTYPPFSQQSLNITVDISYRCVTNFSKSQPIYLQQKILTLKIGIKQN